MGAPTVSPSAPTQSTDRNATAAGRRRIVRTSVIALVVAAVLLVPAGATAQIVLTSHVDDRARTEAIVVLDPAWVWADPHQVLAARLEHAADLYREEVAPVIVLTGSPRDAEEGRRALADIGVPARDIVAFHTGSDTVGALEVIAGVMRDLGWFSATIVTDPAHAARAAATATTLGIDAHVSPAEEGPGTTLTAEYVGTEAVALLRFYAVTRWSLPQIIPSP